jgi:hypothetical protein
MTTQGSWAVVAMGHLDQPLNTFWQLLFRPAGATAWKLVTPTGVADNGGLVADGGSTAAVTAGFEPTQYLRYSPLARSVDSGGQWSTGILPTGLMAVPDAVSEGPLGGVLALSRSSGGTVLVSAGNLSAWRVLARRASLATAAGQACGLVALSAVSYGAGSPEVGASCSRPGMVGILVRSDGSWEDDGIPLPGQAGHLATTVLRLESGPSGTRALVQAGRGAEARLFALWRAGLSNPWTLSASLRPAGAVQATGFGPSNSAVVVTRTASPGNRIAAAEVAGPGSPWTALPVAPRGTAAVVEGPDGEIDALAVSGRILTDYRLGAAQDTWQRVQSLAVPIQYGSST